MRDDKRLAETCAARWLDENARRYRAIAEHLHALGHDCAGVDALLAAAEAEADEWAERLAVKRWVTRVRA